MQYSCLLETQQVVAVAHRGEDVQLLALVQLESVQIHPRRSLLWQVAAYLAKSSEKAVVLGVILPDRLVRPPTHLPEVVTERTPYAGDLQVQEPGCDPGDEVLDPVVFSETTD